MVSMDCLARAQLLEGHVAPKQMAENKWVHGVATLLIGVVTPCMTGDGAHLVVANNSGKKTMCCSSGWWRNDLKTIIIYDAHRKRPLHCGKLT